MVPSIWGVRSIWAMADGKLVGACILAGHTSFIQWPDLYWFWTFKTNYRKLYAAVMHGKHRKLSAACKRVCVTLLVAEAHEQTMSRIASSLYEKFCLLGYIYTMHTATIKLFTTHDYKYRGRWCPFLRTPKDT